MISYPAACLFFAKQFYDGTAVNDVRVIVGLANPQGRVLGVSSQFEGFWRSYVATSSVDLTVERTMTVERLADAAGRLDVAREIAEELVSYFGFEIGDPQWEAHINVANTYIPGLSF